MALRAFDLGPASFFDLFGFSELLVPSPLVLDCHPPDYISLNGVAS